MLQKLYKYGIRRKASDLMKSYLTNRIQYTVVDNVVSKPHPIKTGIPQGSALGPLLFIVYIYDLPQASNFTTRLFAHGTILLMSSPNLKILLHNVNVQLGTIVTWLYNNKLCVNHTKSKHMIFQPNNEKDVEDPHIKISLSSVQDLEQVDTYKYLGVILHLTKTNLGTSYSMYCICKKLAQSLGIIRRIKKFATSAILSSIYYSFVHSYLNYGIISWGSAGETTLKPLKQMNQR